MVLLLTVFFFFFFCVCVMWCEAFFLKICCMTLMVIDDNCHYSDVNTFCFQKNIGAVDTHVSDYQRMIDSLQVTR